MGLKNEHYARIEGEIVLIPIKTGQVEYSTLGPNLNPHGISSTIEGEGIHVGTSLGLWCDLKKSPITPYLGSSITMLFSKMDLKDNFPDIMVNEINSWGFAPAMQIGLGARYQFDPFEIDLRYSYLLIAPNEYNYSNYHKKMRSESDLRSCATIKLQYHIKN